MPRTPDTTCDGCGKPCFRSRPKPGSDWIPPLTHTCRACRAASITHGKASTYKHRGCRCSECRQAWNDQCRRIQTAVRERKGLLTRACISCGSDFRPRANQIICSPACRKAVHGRYGDHASRAAHWGVQFETIDRLAIFERDGWACGICELPVERGLTFPDPGYPTLDHIVPMSQGGGHLAANVQLAHFYCNSVKGARAVEDIAC